jgi:hypothetical protein
MVWMLRRQLGASISRKKGFSPGSQAANVRLLHNYVALLRFTKDLSPSSIFHLPPGTSSPLGTSVGYLGKTLPRASQPCSGVSFSESFSFEKLP